MIKSAMITECWTPQSSHRDAFFSIYLCIKHYLAHGDTQDEMDLCMVKNLKCKIDNTVNAFIQQNEQI